MTGGFRRAGFGSIDCAFADGNLPLRHIQMKGNPVALAALYCLLAASCNRPAMQNARRDIHSFSNPEQIQVQHLDLDCDVLFDQKIIKGTATLTVERQVDNGSPPLILDTRNLRIEKVEAAAGDRPFSAAKFTLGASDPILGAPLTITAPPGATKDRIQHSTSPDASALQWLDPP